jgi:hypothetical protein
VGDESPYSSPRGLLGRRASPVSERALEYSNP